MLASNFKGGRMWDGRRMGRRNQWPPHGDGIGRVVRLYIAGRVCRVRDFLHRRGEGRVGRARQTRHFLDRSHEGRADCVHHVREFLDRRGESFLGRSRPVDGQ